MARPQTDDTPKSANTNTPPSNTLATMDIQPSGCAVGAEVHGVDLSRPVPEDLKTALHNAWLDHLVLLFRDQTLTSKQYLEAARIFGEPQVGAARKYYEKAGVKSRVNSLPEPEVTILSNLDEEGNPTERNSGLGSLEVVWHSDNSYIEKPPAGSCLYSLEVPSESGNTSFNNQYLAYENAAE